MERGRKRKREIWERKEGERERGIRFSIRVYFISVNAVGTQKI